MGDRFFETVLAAHRRTVDAAGVNWKAALYQQMRQEVKRKRLAMERMCVLAGVSRRGFYRFRPEVGTGKRDLELRDEIQRIAFEMASYVRPRITAELRKRVRRIMREDNLLCLRHRKYLVTTDSRHRFAIYPNLAGGLQLTDVNQLLISDLTYIRLETEFVYLAVILDAFSRRVIGWALDRTLASKLTVSALKMALSERCIGPGLVHHSDRGVQYAADEYTGLLDQHGIRIRMSRRGNPYDNAVCESFMKTLKYEEVHRQEYRDLPDALRSLRRFLDKVYNQKRLHFGSGVSLAVRIRAPVVRDESQGGRSAAASFMSFFRHRESFDRCDSIKPGAIRLLLPAHRLDEFRWLFLSKLRSRLACFRFA